MPWQRVEDVSEYRLNTKKLDEWLKSKWGDYDYEIEYHNGFYSFWSLEPKTEVGRHGRVAAQVMHRLMIRLTGVDGRNR
jgi:hypothetical protein